MIKNKIIRRLALLVSLVILITSTVNTTFGFIVTKTDSLINTFVPFDSIINNLIISKNVEHPFGDEYVIPDNIAFDFKINFGALYANTTIKTTNGDIVADKNGSIQISVKPGISFCVEGIDAGTKVTVTEMQKGGNGFTVKDGAATMEGIVAEDGSLKFQYTNIYTPTSVSPTNVSVKGTKILEGRDWQDGDSFTFMLEQKQSDKSWLVLGTKTITYSSKNSTFNYFDFTDLIKKLTFKKIGVYEFRITEVIGNLDNVYYDENINTFAIRVTDVDMDGKLEINTVTAAQNAKVKEVDGNYDVTVTFNNLFAPVITESENITVKIDIDKTVKNTGRSSISPEGFEFVLENIVSGEKLTVKSDKNGDATFTLPFTSADVGEKFTYKLLEINNGRAEVTYDDTVYDISINIESGKDNKLVASVSMNGKIIENPIAEFVNIYHTDLQDSPQTGENNRSLAFWFIMMIISGSTCIFLLLVDRKYRKKYN